MKNVNVYNYLAALNETRIWKLIWIAGNPDREDVEEMIDSMLDDGSFESNFPDIPVEATKHCTQFGDLEQLLMDYGKFGSWLKCTPLRPKRSIRRCRESHILGYSQGYVYDPICLCRDYRRVDP